MKRVNIVVEGQTERSFVTNVLAPALWSHRVYLNPVLLGVLGQKGGRPTYARVRNDVLLRLREDPTAYCSTMLDFYGLGEGFPGTPIPPSLPNIAKVMRIEKAVKADICGLIPDWRPDVRFVPYLQMHEYEGLLFSDPLAFATAIDQPQLSAAFQEVRDNFATPEDINDDPASAPSKRVLKVCHEAAGSSYRKVRDGTRAAQAVGIEAMRRECPHFRDWLDQLAAFGQS